MSLEKVKLDSGLTVYNDRIPGSRTNSVSMFVPYGSVDEKPGDEGIAHAFEHCAHLRAKDQYNLSEYAKLHGMDTNADTFYTRTRYYADGLDLEPNIVHLSEVIQHARFPDEKVANEMKSIRREAVTALDDIDEQHRNATTYAMFGAPYGRDVIGYHDKLDFDSDKLRQLYDRYYKLDRMSLIVSGMAKLDEITSLASQYFTPDDLPYDPADDQDLTVSLGKYHRTGLVRKDSQNVRISVSSPMSTEFRDLYNTDTLALDIAASAISGATFNALRNKKGISYDGGFYLFTDNHPNAWSLEGQVTTDKEHTATALDVFSDILHRRGSRYSDNSILGSIAVEKYNLSYNLMSPSNKIEGHVSSLESYGEPVDVRACVRALAKINIGDIRAAIDQIVDFIDTVPQYTHLTGQRSAIGDAEKIINPSLIS